MKLFRLLPGIVCGSAMIASLAAVPLAPAPSPVLGFTDETSVDTQQFFQAVIEAAEERGAFTPGAAVTILTYDDDRAPSYQAAIDRSTEIWNASVTSVQVQEVASGGDFEYREGRATNQSHAGVDSRGQAYINLDPRQMAVYDQVRVATHETGHVLGLPDHYEGLCSELMSGGGAGPSCTNSQPNTAEIIRVDKNFANGGVPFTGIRNGPVDQTATTAPTTPPTTTPTTPPTTEPTVPTEPPATTEPPAPTTTEPVAPIDPAVAA